MVVEMGRKRYMKIKIGNKTFNVGYKGFNPNLNNFESVEKIYEKYERDFANRKSFISKERSYKRSLLFLREIVQKDQHITRSGNQIIIESINRKRYYISINTGKVYSSKNRFCCVEVSWNGQRALNKIDIIIAKSLTIAYAPQKISTIWK
jgi:hypothetical protein